MLARAWVAPELRLELHGVEGNCSWQSSGQSMSSRGSDPNASRVCDHCGAHDLPLMPCPGGCQGFFCAAHLYSCTPLQASGCSFDAGAQALTSPGLSPHRASVTSVARLTLLFASASCFNAQGGAALCTSSLI